MNQNFQVGLTRDFLTDDGQLTYDDIGLDVLEAHSNIQHRFFERHEPTVTAEQLRDFDAVISLTPRYTPQSFDGVERLAAVVRFGVGYDMVDVKACTEADVLLCITAGAVNHSVAEATITWMLALSHHVFTKDRITRDAKWADRSFYMGRELRDRTLGIVGLGGIGGRLIEMIRGFGMKTPLAHDPFVSPQRANELGARLVSLEELLRESDFVSINCPLTEATRNLIGQDELALMKPDAYLINTARGGIVNEAALVAVLQARRIAGAAMDVYEVEPVKPDNPLLQLDNVILAPHCIAWTDELFRDIGQTACRMTTTIAEGRVPHGVVNREVLERPGFQAKLARYRR
ncbi:MAG TPA: NAD(P)-dependent oxidoreductase [Abditibacteriaceae bacterium]|nr:NAD(P)-dependent oxidoreductase [Abditibacteriaceae bacterium]